MSKHPSREPETAYLKSRRSLEQKRLSTAPSKPISEIDVSYNSEQTPPTTQPPNAISEGNRTNIRRAGVTGISQPLIEELRTILDEDYGKHVEVEEVVQIADGLVEYFDMLARIARHPRDPL